MLRHFKLVPVVRTLEKECPSYRFSYLLEVMKQDTRDTMSKITFTYREIKLPLHSSLQNTVKGQTFQIAPKLSPRYVYHRNSGEVPIALWTKNLSNNEVSR